ncbi:Hsp20/alpha crystallin family protein [Proteinivorax hydrogeniformans]|uniref:Hsp20/alpha crystallin family protein n=1 Tax=Proteinivorax hydrogeniformans TaxID=1826727 RepID=A0AAU8HW74_9FIRM
MQKAIVRRKKNRGIYPPPPFKPSIDIYEYNDEVEVFIDIPGIDPDEALVSINKEEIIIEGETKSGYNREGRRFRVMERMQGSFYRRIPLTEPIDDSLAFVDYDNGTLHIRAPFLSFYD